LFDDEVLAINDHNEIKAINEINEILVILDQQAQQHEQGSLTNHLKHSYTETLITPILIDLFR
jgi:hypothetical protein